MRLANILDDVQGLGADVAAVSVDSPERNAALALRWRLQFPIHSDRGGESVLRALDLWNPDERGGIGWPAVLVFDSAGRETFRFRSRDFSDRPPDDDDLFAALRALALPAIAAPPPWAPGVEPAQDPGALRVEAFGPFFRGIRSGVRGLATRLGDDRDRAEANRMSDMADSFLQAWAERRVSG